MVSRAQKISIVAGIIVVILTGIVYARLLIIRKSPATEISLDSICNCRLLLDSPDSLTLLDPVSAKRTSIEASVPDGSPSPNVSTVSIAPSGKLEFRIDRVKKVLQFRRLPDLTVVQELPYDTNKIIQTVAWSPNENVVAYVAQDQPIAVDGMEPTSTEDTQMIVTLNMITGRGVSIKPPTKNATMLDSQIVSLLDVGNDGTHVIFGWDESLGMRIFQATSTAAITEIKIPSLESNNVNIPLPGGGVMLGVIAGERAFVATKTGLLTFDFAGRLLHATTLNAWSGVPYSPLSPDQGSVVVARHKKNQAYGELVHMNMATGAERTIVSKFELGTGLSQATWLPDGKYLIIPDSYNQRLLVVDTTKKNASLRTVTIRGLKSDDTIQAILN